MREGGGGCLRDACRSPKAGGRREDCLDPQPCMLNFSSLQFLIEMIDKTLVVEGIKIVEEVPEVLKILG